MRFATYVKCKPYAISDLDGSVSAPPGRGLAGDGCLKLSAHSIETISVSLAGQLVRQSVAFWCMPSGAARAGVADGWLGTAPAPPAAQQEGGGLLCRAEAVSTTQVDGFIHLLRLQAIARKQ